MSIQRNESLESIPEATVNAVLGGLLLFCFHEDNQSCELKINTSVDKHELTIEFEGENIGKTTLKFDSEVVKSLHPLHLFVADERTMQPIGNSASRGKNYNKILDLEGNGFFNHSLKPKAAVHGCSIFIDNGIVDGGDLAQDCYRVKEALFPDLDFTTVVRNIWEGYVQSRQLADPTSIIKIEEPFVKNGLAQINLEEDQVLRLTYGPKSTDLFPPLKFGQRYALKIKYEDVTPVTSLSECIGFAHHCKALELEPQGEVNFGLFHLANFGLFHLVFEEGSIHGLCASGCCECARISAR